MSDSSPTDEGQGRVPPPPIPADGPEAAGGGWGAPPPGPSSEGPAGTAKSGLRNAPARGFPRAPGGLGTEGRRLWRRMHAEYDGFEPQELLVLEQVCAAADTIAALRAAVDEGGLIVAGSKGQPRVHPAVAELRLARAAFASLLGKLSLPAGGPDSDDGADDGPPASGATARQRSARKAAETRWSKSPRRPREGRHG